MHHSLRDFRRSFWADKYESRYTSHLYDNLPYPFGNKLIFRRAVVLDKKPSASPRRPICKGLPCAQQRRDLDAKKKKPVAASNFWQNPAKQAGLLGLRWIDATVNAPSAWRHQPANRGGHNDQKAIRCGILLVGKPVPQRIAGREQKRWAGSCSYPPSAKK